MARSIEATALYIGTIVGAGLFGLPFVTVAVGIIPAMIIFCVVCVLFMALHTWYTRVMIAVGTRHRLPGLTAQFLGRRSYIVAMASALFGIYGSLLVYGLLGGIFLHSLFPVFSIFFWAISFLVGAGLLLMFDIKKMGIINFVLTIPFFVLVFLIVILGLPHIDVKNFVLFNSASPFLPYGVMLFSFSGMVAVPEVVTLLTGYKPRQLERLARWGTLIPAFIYLLFIFAVVGVSGNETTPEAFTGLAPFLGSWVLIVGSALGFFTVITSFLILGLYMRDVFENDYSVPRFKAWFLVFTFPLILVLLGARNFLTAMDIVGAVAVGIDGLLVLALYRKLILKKFSIALLIAVILLLAGIVAGIALHI